MCLEHIQREATGGHCSQATLLSIKGPVGLLELLPNQLLQSRSTMQHRNISSCVHLQWDLLIATHSLWPWSETTHLVHPMQKPADLMPFKSWLCKIGDIRNLQHFTSNLIRPSHIYTEEFSDLHSNESSSSDSYPDGHDLQFPQSGLSPSNFIPN